MVRFIKCSGRKEAPRNRADKVVVPVSSISERSTDILESKFRKLLNHLLIGHPGGQPRTSPTEMRMPRMQGRPPRLPGSMVISSRWFIAGGYGVCVFGARHPFLPQSCRHLARAGNRFGRTLVARCNRVGVPKRRTLLGARIRSTDRLSKQFSQDILHGLTQLPSIRYFGRYQWMLSLRLPLRVTVARRSVSSIERGMLHLLLSSPSSVLTSIGAFGDVTWSSVE